MAANNGRVSRYLIDGESFSSIRIRENLSLSDVAAFLGCNKSQVSRWERGLGFPSEDRIRKMTELLKSWEFVRDNPEYWRRQNAVMRS